MLKIDDIQIFIITYNRAHFLQQSIESVLNQTAKVKEIIVLDNGSTDNTKEVVASYADQGVKYICTEGFLGNYYKAREIADKKYCMLFHDDDKLHPKYLEFALNALNKHKNVSLVVSTYKEFYNDSLIRQKRAFSNYYLFGQQKDFAAFVYFMETVSYPNAIFRTDDFKKLDLEYDKYSKFNDWPLMVKMAKFGKVILFEDSNLLQYRVHVNQDTHTTENVLTLEQGINWVRFFNETGKFDNDEQLYKWYLAKADHFLRGRHGLYLSQDLHKKFSYQDYLNLAEEKGIKGILNSEGLDLMKTKEYKKFTQQILKNNRYKSLKNQILFYLKDLKIGEMKQNLNKEDWIKYFKKYNQQKYINKISRFLNGKTAVLYGYGIIGEILMDNYDLSGLNIVGISDAKFSSDSSGQINGIKKISPERLFENDFDVILSALKTERPIFNLLNKNNVKKDVISIVTKENG